MRQEMSTSQTRLTDGGACHQYTGYFDYRAWADSRAGKHPDGCRNGFNWFRWRWNRSYNILRTGSTVHTELLWMRWANFGLQIKITMSVSSV